MKKTLILFVLSLTVVLVFSQSSMPRFGAWLDDTHFYMEDPENTSAYVKINAKNNKKSAYEYSTQAPFSTLLPEGYRIPRTNMHVSSDEDKIVFRQEDDLYMFSRTSKEVRRLTANQAVENNPYFSPDGSKIAFTRGRNLFVIDVASGLETQLTTDGSDIIYNGWASWVYFEEILGRRSRYRAFYWAPDSRRIAYLRFDDSPVPSFPIYHNEGEDMTHGYLEMTHYPKSGDKNPLVELGIVDIENQETTWIKKNKELEYLAWVMWTPDGNELLYQQMNRDQNVIKMYKADLNGGDEKVIYEESQPTWVEWVEHLDFVEDGKGFVIRSNRDGWYNLYHYDLDGKLINQITQNDFRTNSIEKIDEKNQRIFFAATGNNPTEKHLFVVNMDGSGQQQLTKQAGTHNVEVSTDGSYFIDRFSAYDNPGELSLYNSKGKMLAELAREVEDVNKNMGLTVEHFTIPTADGFELPAYWVLPPDFDESKSYPVIFSIYGGPDAASVYNRFQNHSWNPIFIEGVIKFAVDHRSSGKFGKKGLDYMHRSLGKWEMHDYIAAVKWLRTKSFIDPNRIGIQGSSYGGYMAAMALTYGANYFTHGISGSPVTDWRLYDNVYTERYMDEPKDNQVGYDFGSAMTHVDKFKGKLLVIHGTIDDNVHMQNSMQFISKLQDKGKDFELMYYPGGRHGWGGAKGMHAFNLRLNFWRKHFLGKEPSP